MKSVLSSHIYAADVCMSETKPGDRLVVVVVVGVVDGVTGQKHVSTVSLLPQGPVSNVSSKILAYCCPPSWVGPLAKALEGISMPHRGNALCIPL